ncbi:DNA alkylation repair protein [Synechocystis sp. PCC 7338]|uniref:DNA alkylation repair protein n=1 Tax=Synechocystis sp. PCC 7338 TaxID=2732530 RepID=UPI001BAEAFD3|nr:DNA alkylation repair protein [Synechocystis sp. PCC 7338]QUS62488.1 DNA alkylation repair protein [Synechocystis sp. PCC 7338]
MNSWDPQSLLNSLLSDLRTQADASYPDRIATLFNVDVQDFLGVPTPKVRQLSAQYFRELRHLSLSELLEHCEVLLRSGAYECRLIAFDWNFRHSAHLEAHHFDLFESWLRQYVNSWPDCDDLCTHSLGLVIATFPGVALRVIPWTREANRWLRRAAAVSLIYGLRRGLLLADALMVAECLLEEEDELVQKGCGWMLKEASKSYPDDVFEFVLRYRGQLPRLVLRTAIAKLPDSQRQQILKRKVTSH